MVETTFSSSLLACASVLFSVATAGSIPPRSPYTPLTKYYPNEAAAYLNTKLQDDLRLGYRILSINSYDDSVPKHAAVLRKMSGPKQLFRFGTTARERDNFRVKNQSDGYIPVLAGAT
ncbi:MAG: hypothetical protein M1833_001276 [Piccolia ochrophora]|nr:MAG: hypothetical protein M1833_001276 [Piccolia ochrophora]